MKTFDRAFSIYRNYGLEHLLRRSVDHIAWRVNNFISRIFDEYWDAKGGKFEFTVNGVSAEFDASSKNGGKAVRRQMETEYDMIHDVLAHLREDDVFWDIGANIGLFSSFAGQVSDQVYAFEPEELNFEQLRQNTAANAENIEPIRVALSNSVGNIQLETAKSETGYGMGAMNYNVNDDTSGAELVTMTTGDRIISDQDIKPPDIVKIDVEGAEGLVVAGMQEALSDCRKLYCEVHLPADHRTSLETYGAKSVDLFKELSNMGFEIEILKNRGRELQIIGTRG